MFSKRKKKKKKEMKRNQQILCVDPSNPNANKECVISDKPHKITKTYYCIYCHREMEKQLIDDAKDVNSFNGENGRNNVTYVKQGTDTSKVVLNGFQEDTKTKEIRTQFTSIFNKLESGNDAIDDAMKKYREYIIKKAERKDSQETGKKQTVKRIQKDSLIKGIVMIVISERGIIIEKKKLKRLLNWELSDVIKQRNTVGEILGWKKRSVDYGKYDEYLREKCNALGIGQYATQCMDIVEEMFILLEGKEPSTIIACVIYVVCLIYNVNTVTEQQICNQCGSSPETIKKAIKWLSETDKIEKFKSLLRN